MFRASISFERHTRLFTRAGSGELRVALKPQAGSDSERMLAPWQLLNALSRARSLDVLLRSETARPSSSVQNLRGRPPETMPASAGLGAGEEELLFVGGKVLTLSTSARRLEASQLESAEGRGFSLRITTRFSSFAGAGGIEHKVNKTQGGPLVMLPRIGADDIGSLVPLWINAFRFGFELYEPRFFGFSLGSAPRIVRRLYLDSTISAITLFASDEALSGPAAVPFEQTREPQLILRALDESGITSGLEQAVSERLAAGSAGTIQFEHAPAGHS